MECCLLSVCAVSAAFLFVLFYWLVQSNATWALIWHDFITERLRDTLTRSTRPQRMLKAVQQNCAKGNPESVISAIDYFCKHSEWAMNVGDEKGLFMQFAHEHDVMAFTCVLGQ
ncbi:catechol O-methyltransferase A [Tachysurus ichikawai]